MHSSRDAGGPALTIRQATADDIETVLWHRRAMFDEMGFAPEKLSAMAQETRAFFEAALASGEYRGWLAETAEKRVAAGVGLFAARFYPSPREPYQQRAWLLNVYTEPEFRRAGLARRLTQTAIAEAKAQGFKWVHLHASKFGRDLYAQLGFEPTNEMRLEL